jgi:hypothetical protein
MKFPLSRHNTANFVEFASCDSLMLIESGVRVQIQEQAEISLESKKQYLIVSSGEMAQFRSRCQLRHKPNDGAM